VYYSLNDDDDDVKSVAASCLLPVAEHIVEQLPESLDRILVVLWQCLSNMKDDLSSSVGVVMDLLCELCLIFFCNSKGIIAKLVAYEKVIQILAKDSLTYVPFSCHRSKLMSSPAFLCLHLRKHCSHSSVTLSLTSAWQL